MPIIKLDVMAGDLDRGEASIDSSKIVAIGPEGVYLEGGGKDEEGRTLYFTTGGGVGKFFVCNTPANIEKLKGWW